MIDYILTAAVGISVTAVHGAGQRGPRPPAAAPTGILHALILAVIAIINMRGVKESGFAFMLPTFLFVSTLLVTIGFGVYHVLLAAVADTPSRLPHRHR